MISTLRALFLARLFREKLLLVAFAFILMMFWLTSFAGRARAFLGDEQKASVALADQAHWLAHRADIEAAAEKAAAGFDPAKTFDGTALLGKVTQIAGDTGLHNTSSGVSQEPVRSGQFAFHTLDFRIMKVSYPDLMSFYFALQKEKPYIGIQQLRLVADVSNPASLTADFTVSSVEIAHGGVQ